MKFQTGNFKKLCFQTAKRKPYFHSTEKKMLLNSFCLNQTQPELLNGFCHPQILFSFPVTEAPTQGAPSPFTNFPSSCQPCTQIPTKSLLWENLLLPKPHIPPGGVDNKVWRQKPLWMQQILTGQPGAESCCALSPSHPIPIPFCLAPPRRSLSHTLLRAAREVWPALLCTAWRCSFSVC